MLKFNFHLS